MGLTNGGKIIKMSPTYLFFIKIKSERFFVIDYFHDDAGGVEVDIPNVDILELRGD